jgi:hypothetical protein
MAVTAHRPWVRAPGIYCARATCAISKTSDDLQRRSIAFVVRADAQWQRDTAVDATQGGA